MQVHLILKQTFEQAVLKLSPLAKAEMLWLEVEKQYSNKKRCYHNLEHLFYMLQKLNLVKNKFPDWDIVLMALFYHDVVYKTSRKDNEEKSALYAEAALKNLEVEAQRIQFCKELIMATKAHQVHQTEAINYFTDADLSVLGAPTDIYSDYVKNIRKEYGIYPDFLYKPGRKKIIEHFLAMPRIFKTDFFFSEFEQQARINLETERNLYS